MAVFIALLRAVNLAGTGMLKMKELAALCEALDYAHVRTYIQSGNVIFHADGTEKRVKASLEKALAEKMGKRVDVILRTPGELRSALKANPFPDAKPAYVGVLFLDKAVPASLLEGLAGPDGEQVRPIGREVFIHYPAGMGRSRLKLPPLGPSTTRNLNTLAKLVEIVASAPFCETTK